MADRTRLFELLNSLRAEAAERVQHTLETLETLTRSRRNESDDDEHDPEGVTLSTEWSRLSGLFDAAVAHLAQVDAAIERWHGGTYGICVTCGEAIPEGRLEARPFAEQCVRCAEASGR